MAQSMTELEAVNICLRAVGESPVTTTSSQNPYVIAASNIVNSERKNLLAEGWWFNTQRQLTLTPDRNKFIFVPINTLAINTNDRNGAIAVRKDKLIDLYNNTFEFNEPITLDLVEDLSYEELPFSAARAIAYLSAVEMQRAYEMEVNKLESYQQQASFALMELKKLHMRNRNLNHLNSPQSVQMMGAMSVGYGRTNPNIIGG